MSIKRVCSLSLAWENEEQVRENEELEREWRVREYLWELWWRERFTLLSLLSMWLQHIYRATRKGKLVFVSTMGEKRDAQLQMVKVTCSASSHGERIAWSLIGTGHERFQRWGPLHSNSNWAQTSFDTLLSLVLRSFGHSCSCPSSVCTSVILSVVRSDGCDPVRRPYGRPW